MQHPSTENLVFLPNPRELKKICKSISALEAIICPEWEFRYYSYQKDWSKTEEFCEMRDGQGNQMLILFKEEGCCINGFAQESKVKGSKFVDELPKVFSEFIFGEPVKSIGTTFCIWSTKTDIGWKTGEINILEDEYKDGSKDLLQLLDGKPFTYKKWAEEYYEENFEDRELDLQLVKKVFDGTVITKELVNEINPELEDYESLKVDLDEIGYENRL